MKWGPAVKKKKRWARHRQTNQSLTLLPHICRLLSLFCFNSISVSVLNNDDMLLCCVFLGWHSPEVTSPGWQSVLISTMRLLTLAMFRWASEILPLWLLQQRVTIFSNCVFGSSPVTILVNCSRNASVLKCNVAVKSISLFVSSGQFHLHYCISFSFLSVLSPLQILLVPFICVHPWLTVCECHSHLTSVHLWS